MGTTCLILADIEQASSYFQKAMEIYKSIWEDDPEFIDNKYKQIQELYIEAGFQIGYQLSEQLRVSQNHQND